MPGDGMQWCPKCGDVAIPVGEPSCRECEPQSVELSYEDLVKEGVRLRARVKELEARATNPQSKSKPAKPEANSDEERVYVTPPKFFTALNKDFHFTPGFDPCPFP